MTIKANRIERYYDTHDIEGAELTQSVEHYLAIQYLIAVLQWIFSGQKVGVISNVNFYKTNNGHEKPVSPDVAVVDGLELKERNPEEIKSLYVGEDSPPPRVAFEIASTATWQEDLQKKPAKYYHMGVKEYFIYDPNPRAIWTGQWRKYNQLVGWRRNDELNQFDLIEKDEAGRLWSEELASWLIIQPEGLRLYTAEGQLRLTEAEDLKLRLEAEKRVSEAERQENSKLKEMLRKLGHNPDELVQ